MKFAIAWPMRNAESTRLTALQDDESFRNADRSESKLLNQPAGRDFGVRIKEDEE